MTWLKCRILLLILLCSIIRHILFVLHFCFFCHVKYSRYWINDHFSKLAGMVLGIEPTQKSVLFVSKDMIKMTLTLLKICDVQMLSRRTVKDFSNTTDLCIQEAGSHICWFQCTRSFPFQRGCILRCIGILCFLHTLGGRRNSTSSCHWWLDRVCHTLWLRSQKTTSHETRYGCLLAPSLLEKCLFLVKQGQHCCFYQRETFCYVF